MATYQELELLVLGWPETTSTPSYGGFPALRVNEKLFARLRGEMQDDPDALTGRPFGEVLMVGVADLGEKEGLLADDPRSFLTVPHYDGYPAILVRLAEVELGVARELLLDSWWRHAPQRARKAYVAEFGEPGQESS